MNTFCASTEQVTKSVSRHWLSAKSKSRVSAHRCHTDAYQRYRANARVTRSFRYSFVCARSWKTERASEWSRVSEREGELVNPSRIGQSEGRELRCDRTRQGTNRCENTFPGSEVVITCRCTGRPASTRFSSSIVSMISGPTKFLPVCTLLYSPFSRELSARFIDCRRGWYCLRNANWTKDFPVPRKTFVYPLLSRTKPSGNSIENSLCREAKFQAGFHPCRSLWIFISWLALLV